LREAETAYHSTKTKRKRKAAELWWDGLAEKIIIMIKKDEELLMTALVNMRLWSNPWLTAARKLGII